ncbi:hypothetical protein GCM10022269_21240 [Sphingorhabdus rigui]
MRGQRFIAVPQHGFAAYRTKLFGDISAHATSRASGKYERNGDGYSYHSRALATAHLPAKPKAGNGLPKF